MLLDKGIPVKYVLGKVRYDLIAVFLLGLVVHYVSAGLQAFLPDIPLTVPAFLGTAISVLLSFKMNQSYDRWWEARKIWGAIVNDSRTWVVQLQTFLAKEETGVIKKLAYRQIAWCYSLGQSLRGLNPLNGIENLITEKDEAEVLKHTNKPLALLKLNANELQRLR